MLTSGAASAAPLVSNMQCDAMHAAVTGAQGKKPWARLSLPAPPPLRGAFCAPRSDGAKKLRRTAACDSRERRAARK